MNKDQKFELIIRGVSEVVKDSELCEILEKNKKPTIYHGFEPSGSIFHIGYLIGINKHLDFQRAGLKLKILLADFHALLNEKGSIEKIKKVAKLYSAGFESLGVDMESAEFILGSSFQLSSEYFEDLMKLSLKVRMLRAKRSMTMVGREEADPHVSQFFYPLMQVLDIKALKTDIAFGDFAQRKLHMLAREELPKIGYKAPIAMHHEFMTGLTGGKMSVSNPKSSIFIDEDPAQIKKKINSAYCPEKKEEENPILEISKYIIFPRKEKLEINRDQKYGGDIVFNDYKELRDSYVKGDLHPSDLKKSVSESLSDILEPVRKKFSSASIKKIKEEVSN